MDWIRRRQTLGWAGGSLVMAVIIAGCSGDDAGPLPEADTTSADTGPAESSTTSGDGATTTTGVGPTTGPPPATDDGAGVTTGDDDPGIGSPCTLEWQDCPLHLKCAPHVDDNGVFSGWCVPRARDPAGLDEPCTMEESPQSGLDDCDLGLVCTGVDEQLQGTCSQLCDPFDGVCPEGLACTSSQLQFPYWMCRPTCDPLAPDCPDGEGCYWLRDFVCAPDQSRGGGYYFGACDGGDDCDPGLQCINAFAFEQCSGLSRCCSPLCDLGAPDPDAPCTAPGHVCVAWFEPGNIPPGYEDVGACALP
jgi:hypothetical protein